LTQSASTMKTTPLPLLTLALAAWAALPAQAQSLSAQAQDHAAHHHGSDDNAAPPQAPATAPPAATTPLHTGHDESLPSSSHSHNHTPTQPDTTQSPPDGMAPMAQGDADGQGGAAPLDARDPNAYSDGLVRGAGVHAIPGVSPLRLADEHRFGALVLDRLERAHTRGGDNATAYDLQAWYGRDFDKAVLKAEGEVAGGTLHDARTELLWGHAITPYWDTQLGVRYDAGTGPDRGWLAFGVQGLAPYWFEVEATAYLGDGGRSALRLAASYDLLLTQKAHPAAARRGAVLRQERSGAHHRQRTVPRHPRPASALRIQPPTRPVPRIGTRRQLRPHSRLPAHRRCARTANALAGRCSILVLAMERQASHAPN